MAYYNVTHQPAQASGTYTEDSPYVASIFAPDFIKGARIPDLISDLTVMKDVPTQVNIAIPAGLLGAGIRLVVNMGDISQSAIRLYVSPSPGAPYSFWGVIPRGYNLSTNYRSARTVSGRAEVKSLTVSTTNANINGVCQSMVFTTQVDPINLSPSALLQYAWDYVANISVQDGVTAIKPPLSSSPFQLPYNVSVANVDKIAITQTTAVNNPGWAPAGNLVTAIGADTVIYDSNADANFIQTPYQYGYMEYIPQFTCQVQATGAGSAYGGYLSMELTTSGTNPATWATQNTVTRYGIGNIGAILANAESVTTSVGDLLPLNVVGDLLRVRILLTTYTQNNAAVVLFPNAYLPNNSLTVKAYSTYSCDGELQQTPIILDAYGLEGGQIMSFLEVVNFEACPNDNLIQDLKGMASPMFMKELEVLSGIMASVGQDSLRFALTINGYYAQAERMMGTASNFNTQVGLASGGWSKFRKVISTIGRGIEKAAPLIGAVIPMIRTAFASGYEDEEKECLDEDVPEGVVLCVIKDEETYRFVMHDKRLKKATAAEAAEAEASGIPIIDVSDDKPSAVEAEKPPSDNGGGRLRLCQEGDDGGRRGSNPETSRKHSQRARKRRERRAQLNESSLLIGVGFASGRAQIDFNAVAERRRNLLAQKNAPPQVMAPITRVAREVEEKPPAVGGNVSFKETDYVDSSVVEEGLNRILGEVLRGINSGRVNDARIQAASACFAKFPIVYSEGIVRAVLLMKSNVPIRDKYSQTKESAGILVPYNSDDQRLHIDARLQGTSIQQVKDAFAFGSTVFQQTDKVFYSVLQLPDWHTVEGPSIGMAAVAVSLGLPFRHSAIMTGEWNPEAVAFDKVKDIKFKYEIAGKMNALFMCPVKNAEEIANPSVGSPLSFMLGTLDAVTALPIDSVGDLASAFRYTKGGLQTLQTELVKEEMEISKREITTGDLTQEEAQGLLNELQRYENNQLWKSRPKKIGDEPSVLDNFALEVSDWDGLSESRKRKLINSMAAMVTIMHDQVFGAQTGAEAAETFITNQKVDIGRYFESDKENDWIMGYDKDEKPILFRTWLGAKFKSVGQAGVMAWWKKAVVPKLQSSGKKKGKKKEAGTKVVGGQFGQSASVISQRLAELRNRRAQLMKQ